MSFAFMAGVSSCAIVDDRSGWQESYDAADRLFMAGEYDQAITGFQQTVEMATSSEDRRASIYAQAVSRVWGEDFAGARDLLADLSARYREAGDEEGLNQALALHVFVLRHLGELDAADALDAQREDVTGGLDPFIWRYDEDSELTKHLATGMTFPAQIGAFYQARISQNDEYGRDVAVEYRLETTSGIEKISVELVYKPDVPYADFVSESFNGLYIYPGEPVYENDFLFNLIRNGRAISVRRYNITLDSYMGEQRPYRSDMWIIPVDNWAIRLFHIYPSSMAAAADKAFLDFYENLEWPSEFPDFTSDLEPKEGVPDIDPALAALLEKDSDDFEEFREDLIAMSDRADLSADERGRAYGKLAYGYWFGADDKEKGLEAARKSAGLLDDKFRGWWRLVQFAQSAEKSELAAEALINLMREAPDRHSDIELSWFWRVWRGLREVDAHEQQLALLRAAYDLGFRKGGTGSGADYIYLGLLELLLESGDLEEAAAIAGEISTAGPWISIVVDRKYEPLWNSENIDIGAIMDDLAHRNVRVAMDGTMTHPESVTAMSSLIEALHYSGQLAEAEKIIAKVANNTELYNASDSDWYWFMNGAAYLFEDMGQFERANRIMQTMADIKPEDDGEIVNQIINFGAMLVRQGDPTRALEILSIVDGTEHVSPYGQGWIDSSAACAYEIMADQAAANTAAVHLTENPDENYAAAMQALLCLNRLEEAAGLAITRLRDENARTGMLEAFANYKDSSNEPDYERELSARLQAVRDRPEVLAEIDKYGRIVDFPLERVYWGEF